ncbi:MAG: hypothetical protein CSA62_03125 [Planctomycetota bacterium]|nr:MAG: hypothetical protein CSA62_03125 [Planctomycetota bacterium]
MIGRFLEIALERKGEPALADDRQAWSFAELSDRVRAYSEGLARSHKRPIIYSALPGGPDQVAVFLACLSVNAIHVPVPETIDPEQLRRCSSLLPPDAILFDEELDLEGLQQRYAGALPQNCILLLAGMRAPTVLSGVRGHGRLCSLPESVRFANFDLRSAEKPRALLFAEANFRADLEQSAAHFEAYAGQRLFSVLGPSDPVSCSVVLGHLMQGSGLILSSCQSMGEQIEQIRRERPRGLLAPAQWLQRALSLLDFGRDELPSLKEIVLAAGPASFDLITQLADAFSGLPIHIRYGIPESIGALLRYDYADAADGFRPGYLGQALPGVELEDLPLLGSGRASELRLRAPSLAIAYTEEFGEWELLADENGWFGSGDVVQKDPRGGIFQNLWGRRPPPKPRHGVAG